MEQEFTESFAKAVEDRVGDCITSLLQKSASFNDLSKRAAVTGQEITNLLKQENQEIKRLFEDYCTIMLKLQLAENKFVYLNGIEDFNSLRRSFESGDLWHDFMLTCIDDSL